MKKTSILLVYTGGTIGMRSPEGGGPLQPFDFSGIAEQCPELTSFGAEIDSYTFNPLIDSSDADPSLWKGIAKVIEDNYSRYDGFVILHGTDTLAFTASALSFMLGSLSKPVIFTGSQLPIGVPRTDGRENLISAIEIASAKDSCGHPIVPEVCIYFGSALMRGCRATKSSSEDFYAFSSPNCPLLAESGVRIRYNESLIRKPASYDAPLKVNYNLDTSVSILKIHPGITPSVVRNILLGEDTRAVIIETYGSGNAPSAQWFIDLVKEADRRGKIIVNVTQCSSGSVNMGIYANGKNLENAGVVSGNDSTTEAMLAKLFVLLGETDDNDLVRRKIGKNMRGEISN